MAVIVTAAFRPQTSREADVVEALTRAIPAVHDEAGCELYALHHDERGGLLMIEKWSDEHALAAHAAGPAVQRLNASLEGLLEEAPEVRTYHAVPAGSERAGVL